MLNLCSKCNCGETAATCAADATTTTTTTLPNCLSDADDLDTNCWNVACDGSDGRYPIATCSCSGSEYPYACKGSPCSGTVSLTLTPNPVDPQSSVIPSASSISNCAGKRVYFKEGSCTGTQVSYCDIGASGTGCTGAPFTAPKAATQPKTYYACIT